MPLQLSEKEARILGSLVEKSLTTPDLYPLSINSLTNACNQKTSREPVMNLDEADVARTLAALREKSLISPRSEPGSRITKFAHRVENLIGGGTSKEVALVCVLLLRGPQTSGELRIRTDRMAQFASAQEVESILQEMAGRPDPLLVRLPRQPGQKEARYQHLFCGAIPLSPLPPQVGEGKGEGRFTAVPSSRPSPAQPLQRWRAPAEGSVAGVFQPGEGVGRQPINQLANLIGQRFAALEQRVAYLEARLAAFEK